MTVAQTATNETVVTQSNGNRWNGKPLSLRIIGTNQGMREHFKVPTLMTNFLNATEGGTLEQGRRWMELILPVSIGCKSTQKHL
jgi:hypothetical protein